MRNSGFLFLVVILLVAAAIVHAGAADPSITMIPGKTEALLGEAIYITGTIDGVNTDKVYLLLSGTGLDEDGVTMVNLNYKASDGKFTEVPVTSDGKWTYKWNTGYIGGFTPGQYKIYAISAPVPLGDLGNSGEIYRSESIVIRSATDEKMPLITIDADPSVADQGHVVRLTGYCEGVNTYTVFLFITGPGIDGNGAPLGDLTAKASEGSFSEVPLSGSANSYGYSLDTSVVPPGDYKVYAVTGPDDLSKLGKTGNIYAETTLKIKGDYDGEEGPETGTSAPVEGQANASTPLSIFPVFGALTAGFVIFGFSRR